MAAGFLWAADVGAAPVTIYYSGTTGGGDALSGWVTYDTANAGSTSYIPGQDNRFWSSGGSGCWNIMNGTCMEPAGSDLPVVTGFRIESGGSSYGFWVLPTFGLGTSVGKSAGIFHGNYFEAFGVNSSLSFVNTIDPQDGNPVQQHADVQEFSLSWSAHSPGALFASIDDLTEFAPGAQFGLSLTEVSLDRTCLTAACRGFLTRSYAVETNLTAMVSIDAIRAGNAEVPEPTPIALLGIATLAGLGASRARTRKAG